MKLMICFTTLLFISVSAQASGANAKYSQNNVKSDINTNSRSIASEEGLLDHGALISPSESSRKKIPKSYYKVKSYSVDGKTCVVSFITTLGSQSADTAITCFKPD